VELKFARAVGGCRTGAIADAQPALLAARARAGHPGVEVVDTAALIVTAK
jgi:hypothetical protein